MEILKLDSLFSQFGLVQKSSSKVRVVPVETVAKISAKMGGISKACCSGQLPHNEQQVMYFQRKSASNPADELYEVMSAAKQEEKGSKYTRAIRPSTHSCH